jgi:predicted CXXCH cytochrome family protein
MARLSLIAGGALALWLGLATTALAGEFHTGTTLLCSDCHTMHYSQSHNYDGSTPVVPALAGGPSDYLLKASNTNALCLSCHDGQTFAPDVRGDHANGYDRLGGALPDGSAGHEQWTGHTLGIQATPPGGFSSMKLDCANCHAAHGNTNYRNLGLTAATVTYAKGTNILTRDVFLRGWTQGDLAGNYGLAAMDYNEPNARDSGMSRFCRGCHVDFHGRAGDSSMGGTGGTAWERHPTADADIGAKNTPCVTAHSCLDTFRTTPYRVKVMSATGDWGTQGVVWAAPPTSLTPACLSCHRAHGSRNPFALIYPAGNLAMTEDGGGTTVRELCLQCHSPGN